MGDNADAFPSDATETADADGDGVGDNADAFPDDASETVDTDDGVGDNADLDPNTIALPVAYNSEVADYFVADNTGDSEIGFIYYINSSGVGLTKLYIILITHKTLMAI